MHSKETCRSPIVRAMSPTGRMRLGLGLGGAQNEPANVDSARVSSVKVEQRRAIKSDVFMGGVRCFKPAGADSGKDWPRGQAKTAQQKRHENKGWQAGADVLQTPSAFNWSGLNVSNQELEFKLCHSIGVCARRPLWAANETCSSAMSASSCSRNAASGRRATASPACAKPRRTRRPVRDGQSRKQGS